MGPASGLIAVQVLAGFSSSRAARLHLLRPSSANRDPSSYQPEQPDPYEPKYSNPSSSTGFGSGQESPIQDTADAAIRATEDISDNTTAGINQAANAATAAVNDASDAATSFIDDTAQAATDAVSDAYDTASTLAADTAQAANTAVSDAADAVSSAARDAAAAADQLLGETPGVDFSNAGSEFDSRFEGMKVLVTGATGALGRWGSAQCNITISRNAFCLKCLVISNPH